MRVRATLAIILLLSPLVYGGGPGYVAGAGDFDPAVSGTPLTWVGGVLNYYTDQGDLSPQLPAAAARDLIADAFSRWTSIPTAAISAMRAGSLDENVSGANVFTNADGSISLPADVLPSAVGKPITIIYDADGSVLNALLGAGAGDAALCFTNSVMGAPDSFSQDAHFQHALIVINGNCAQTAAQLPDLKYRLVRTLGRVLGLDWSQANLNPSVQDVAGFPVMHELDPIACVPVSKCYPGNPDQPRMDDRAAISRLYPVTAQNIADFPGKTLFYENTVRLRGSVRFTDENGEAAQPMQGVNVVARWIDPATNQISKTFVASSVSGFLFRGNAGNSVTGYVDFPSGEPLDRFGSSDPALGGFFDLAGLEIPDGSDSASYQISVEPLDPLWSDQIGPYGPWQVAPSGIPLPMVVTIHKGGDLQQDILMRHSAVHTPDWFGTQSFGSPAAVPGTGDWSASLSGYGDTDYFRFSGRSNRTVSVEVTALNESGAAVQNKAMPVVGIWPLADTSAPAPAASLLAFNTLTFATTRVNANLLATTDFRIGIADFRGDGRPDFRYRARVFYADSVAPQRAGAQGGAALFIRGLGFRPNTTARIDNAPASVLSVSAGRVLVAAPALPDGVHSVTLSDPATTASSTMTGAIIYGAGPNDTLKLIAGANPATPVGAQAPNAIRFQVLAPDGVTPVEGATVRLLSSPPVSLSACGGSSSCTAFSDQGGQVVTAATVLAPGVMAIIAQLAPDSYSAPKQVQTTLSSGVSAPLNLVLASPTAWVAQGGAVNLPLTARVLAAGVPVGGKTVNYQLLRGTASVSPLAVITGPNGSSTSMVTLPSLTSEVQVSACVAPENKPCQVFHAFPVAASSLHIGAVAGTLQFVANGQSFHTITVRITDSAGNPVSGTDVDFQAIITRASSPGPVASIGDTNVSHNPVPVVLGSWKLNAISDSNGLASIQPPALNLLDIVVTGSAACGSATLPFTLQLLPPAPVSVVPSRSLFP